MNFYFTYKHDNIDIHMRNHEIFYLDVRIFKKIMYGFVRIFLNLVYGPDISMYGFVLIFFFKILVATLLSYNFKAN